MENSQTDLPTGPEKATGGASCGWPPFVTTWAICHSRMPQKTICYPRVGIMSALLAQLISSPEMQEIWHCVTPPLREQDIVKLAIGPKKAGDLAFSDWEAILAEIITGDAFGVDRMDYLLRDSHHAGVAYGKFDHYRLIDTLRILPTMRSGEGRSSREPVLGMEEGRTSIRRSADACKVFHVFSGIFPQSPQDI